ncbi:MAG: DUF3060 domain-containing protein [Pyrinomonadaceae bacterium]
MMRTIYFILCLICLATLPSCDLRSGIAKKNMEKYVSTPTPRPSISPTPASTPIDPADIVEVDMSVTGDTISVNGYDEKGSAACNKFNRVMINGDANEVTITGVCSQIMVNGDRNEINADAAREVVFNGSENTVKYARFPNGMQPSVTNNREGNVIEKSARKK